MRAIKFYLFIPILLSLVMTVQARSLPEFTQLVEQYGPAVVNISTTEKREETPSTTPRFHGLPELPKDSPFHDFFRRFFDEEMNERNPSTSLGSGFIISADGYIVTNHHVIKNATEIIVRLNDRRELNAELIGSDERSDLALLKIDATDLPSVKLGSSANLKVGEWVLAIGSPFGFEHSATAGIISATGRSLPNDNYIPFIQTDVAINPGNSGGPLFNLDGEVIGVNAQIYSRTGGFMGLSFAIPVDVMNNVVAQIKNEGRVVRGWLGVLIQDVTRDLAESFNMEKPMGALVAQVLADSPAEEAQLQVGDIITTFNGQSIDRSSDLPPIVGLTPVNSLAKLEIIRKGETKTLKVKIGELPSSEELQRTSGNSENTINSDRIGLTVQNLTDEQKSEFNTDKGVLVTKLERGIAQDAGISVNDIILEINQTAIENVSQFRQIITDLPKGRSVAVLIMRAGSPRFLAMRIPN